ncbi:MAG: hypothetical protein HZB10_00250 [Candidatus Yonathbacteria bacterium]|nr:hypothetical protein [Candidatus Yonathbacteria bacterium]
MKKLKKFLLVALIVCAVGATGVAAAGYWFFAYALPEAMQNAEQEWDAQRMIDLEKEEKIRCAKMSRKERRDAWECQ